MGISDRQRALEARGTLSRWAGPDGWDHRRFDMPAAADIAPRGAILFQGGRGDIIEKYYEAFAHWADRGWHVASFDWRGQGGSGRLGRERRVGHVGDFAPWIADLAAFWDGFRQGRPGPHVLMGHSMGGHLILRALVEDRVDPAAAVLVAPMLGLFAPPFGPGIGRHVARLLALGAPDRAAWRDNELPGTRFARNVLLTGDATRYADELAWKAERPDIALGPPSWGWVATALASTHALERDPRLAQVTMPLLIVAADADRLVDARATARIATKLPDAALVRFGSESAHEILREADPVRDRALAAIDDFLDARAAAA